MRHDDVPASPPASFPLYGLEASWPGARWLESFGDQHGDPPRWVSLGHQSPGARALITVHTYAGPQADVEDAAFGAAVELVNRTLPGRQLTRPPGFLTALARRADEAGRQHQQWPTVGWHLDGRAVPARTWWFAGGWAAVTDAVDGTCLAAVGLGTGPEDLRLAVLPDGRAYHFGLDQPLDPDVMAATRAAAGVAPSPPRPDWHPDQLGLL